MYRFAKKTAETHKTKADFALDSFFPLATFSQLPVLKKHARLIYENVTQ